MVVNGVLNSWAAVEISSDVLIQTTSGFLRTSSLPIFAYNENPEAFITEDDTLREYTLDERYLTLTLTEERFQDYTALSTSGFTLTGAPLGTSIQSVTGNSPTNATLHMAFDGTDFGDEFTTESVTVDAAPPSVSNVKIVPATPSLLSNLRVEFEFDDPNGLEDQSLTQWLRNGSPVSELNDARLISRAQ